MSASIAGTRVRSPSTSSITSSSAPGRSVRPISRVPESPTVRSPSQSRISSKPPKTSSTPRKLSQDGSSTPKSSSNQPQPAKAAPPVSKPPIPASVSKTPRAITSTISSRQALTGISPARATMPDLSETSPTPLLSQASLKQSQDNSKPPLTKYNLSPKQKDTEFSEISSISSGSVMSNSNASMKKIPFSSWWFAKGKGSDVGDELHDDSHDDIYNEVYSDVHHEVYNSVEHEEVRRLQAQINMVMNGESVEPPKGLSRSELEQWWKVE